METFRHIDIDSVRERRRLELERLAIDPASGRTILPDDCSPSILNGLLRGRISDLDDAIAEAQVKLDTADHAVAAGIMKAAVPQTSRSARSKPEAANSEPEALLDWTVAKDSRRFDLEALNREGRTRLAREDDDLNVLLRAHLMDLEDAIRGARLFLERGQPALALGLLERAVPPAHRPASSAGPRG